MKAMYQRHTQLTIEDFVFPLGKLDEADEWIRLAHALPWEEIEDRYAPRFARGGHAAYPARMAMGALLIKQRLGCSDEWVVRHVAENPYLQYFLGMKTYADRCPFGKSTMGLFRRRFDPEYFEQISRLAAKLRRGEKHRAHPQKP
jgi:hypothetical protein